MCSRWTVWCWASAPTRGPRWRRWPAVSLCCWTCRGSSTSTSSGYTSSVRSHTYTAVGGGEGQQHEHQQRLHQLGTVTHTLLGGGGGEGQQHEHQQRLHQLGTVVGSQAELWCIRDIVTQSNQRDDKLIVFRRHFSSLLLLLYPE